VLRLPDAWVWDFWLAEDGTTDQADRHIFYLKASRALHDPARRHLRASIGHAVSTDLRTWTELPDALVPSDRHAFDDQATWTGSLLRGPDGSWYLFYTGVSVRGGALLQQIGLAGSDDLVTWHRHGAGPLVTADPRWYEKLGESSWPDEHWRDPWVFCDPGGDGWHMLITARANHGPDDDRGVIGHARSHDLLTWEVQPPLSLPGAGFGQLEVPQTATVAGRHTLLFSSLPSDLTAHRRATTPDCGTWALAIDDPTGPYDVAAARPVTGCSLYSGRITHHPDGGECLLAFHNANDDSPFEGSITAPMRLAWNGSNLILAQDSPAAYWA
jgi:beta-fructofuranosidase